MKSLARALIVGVVGAAIGFAAPAPAGAVDAPMGVVTNDPGHKWAISNRIQTLIENAPAGSIIRIAQYRLAADDPNIIPALRDAFARGVRVRIVLDKSDKNATPFASSWRLDNLRADIAASLGTASDPSKSSFIVLCDDGCIGTAYQHNKFYLFTRSGTLSNVVVQSTANSQASNADAWNAAYAVAGRDALFNGFQDYFADLKDQVRNSNYYRTTTDGNLKSYFFPRASSTGDADDPSTDTIVGILDNVRCTGNTTVGTSTNHRTIIRVAMWGFTREEVARKLRQLANDDCWIDVALNQSASPTEVSSEVKALLANHARINVDNAESSGMWMHAKYLLIEGNYDGTADNKVAWLGSHNFTLNALRNSDESWLKIDSAAAHDDLRTQFRDIMTRSADFTF